jgi:hypothetical protein
VWKRCDCLKQELSQRKYTIAGITFKLEDLDLKMINAKFPQSPVEMGTLNQLIGIEDDFKSKDFPLRLTCIKGSTTGPKDMIVQCILKSAVEVGYTVIQRSMQDLIKSHFKEEDYGGLEEEFKSSEVFVLDFGAEIQNNVGGSFLQELVRYSHKYNIYLLLTTSLKYDSIGVRYGEEIGKLFLRPGTVTNEFDKRVVFIPLEG